MKFELNVRDADTGKHRLDATLWDDDDAHALLALVTNEWDNVEWRLLRSDGNEVEIVAETEDYVARILAPTGAKLGGQS